MKKRKKRVAPKLRSRINRKPKKHPNAGSVSAGSKLKTRAKTAPKLKKMSKKDLKKFKELLIGMRSQVGGDLSHITENTLNKSARDASGDLSGYSYHMADMASDDYERDFALGRATDEQQALYSIDEAMKRVEEGVYGNCLQCNKPISKKRLAALPNTELCIECQKKNEEK
jgi:RNA polymerase-binding protein DksA